MTVDRLEAEVEFGVMVAFAAAEIELPEARKRSHDALIEHLGARRRSGVEWFQFDARDALRVLGELSFPVTPGMRQWLANYPDSPRRRTKPVWRVVTWTRLSCGCERDDSVPSWWIVTRTCAEHVAMIPLADRIPFIEAPGLRSRFGPFQPIAPGPAA